MYTKEMYLWFRSYVRQNRIAFETLEDLPFETALLECDSETADADEIDQVYALALEGALKEIERLRPDLAQAGE